MLRKLFGTRFVRDGRRQCSRLAVRIPASAEAIVDEPAPSLLASCEEDVSYYGKVDRTFNLAKYVNQSETLQNLVKLGVSLHKLESNRYLSQRLLRLDFDKDIKKYIVFLSDYVEPNRLGTFITKNPKILFEDLDDLQIRVNYLQSKNFTTDMIKRIVSTNPNWLSYKVRKIDELLGYFQSEFRLSGREVRYLSTKQPRLITCNLEYVRVNTFSIREEMGFENEEVKKIILNKPRLLMINKKSLIKRFHYVHIVMKINLEDIVRTPEILTCKTERIRERHEFLQKLGLAQYDRTKPNYVSLKRLITGNDANFCLDVAKCSITEYNIFLKSL